MNRDALLARFKELLEQANAVLGPSLLAELHAMLDGFAAALPTEPGDPAVDGWHGMLGRSPELMALRPLITKYAASKAPVLVAGESGTGKDLVAHALHALSPRHQQAFVSENCAAIPETLLESVLFGHVKGSFTGAVRDHSGHFVAADKGTLFLDEIGDMPHAMQVKMLRALQEGEIRPVGGSKVRKVDVRVVAATNKDLAAMVARGAFREDLYYRLNVLQLTLPPLRARGEDVLLLARAFLSASCKKTGRFLTLGPDAEAVLMQAKWPGNIRQLQNEIQRVAALADGPIVHKKDLSEDLLT